MFTRLSLVVVASIALVVGPPAGASPITYAFTGSLDQPFNGSNQFSGSFTINGDPTVSGYPGSVTENGNDVSLIVKMGGQTFDFANQPSSNSVAWFTAGPSATWLRTPVGPSQDEISIYGANGSGNPNTSFGMSFYNPSSIDQLSNLRTLNFNLSTGSIYTTFHLGSTDSFATGGSITSINLVPTQVPEPSTLAFFASIGAVAWARSVRSRRAPSSRIM